MNQDTQNLKPSGQRILVIDDELPICLGCCRILQADGHHVETQQGGKAGLEAALKGQYDLILLDVSMPDLDGLSVLQEVKKARLSAEVIMMTGFATVKNAVEAMKCGAADYIGKPFSPDELRLVLAKVIERNTLIRENADLRRQLAAQNGFEGMLGNSRAMEQVFSLIKRIAASAGTGLISGESGTGKELVSQALHRLSPRSTKPFLACDCTTLAPSLLESELFGHVKGSFTGALATKRGLFEVANGGTLFLDEISNISLEIQGKLLRVLESRRVRKVGDTAEGEVDIRLIAATNRQLSEMVKEGKFREDLLYRLNVLPINLPPLRERSGDVPLLATAYLERLRNGNKQITACGFTPAAIAILESYPWPGNVRELRNIIERVAILCESERIDAQHIPAEIQNSPLTAIHGSLPENWEDFKVYKRQAREAATYELERRFLVRALERSSGNVTKAAEAVGMQRTNFHALLSKYGLS